MLREGVYIMICIAISAVLVATLAHLMDANYEHALLKQELIKRDYAEYDSQSGFLVWISDRQRVGFEE